jgi:asparaginyl-tRNA synthetase
MPANSIAQLLTNPESQLGKSVRLQGWIRTRRDSKGGLSFLQVSDGSCFATMQVVAPGDLENYESDVLRLTSGSSVEIEGDVVESRGKGQAIEIKATRITAIGFVEDPDTYPISPKQHSFEYLREVAHLRPRTNTFGAVARVRNCLAMAIHEFFQQDGFQWIHTPIITANDCEGAGEMFRVSTLDLENIPRDEAGAIDFSQDFFGRESHLTVSGQLAAECWCLALSKVYTFGPTFRAENSNTTRHLAEFWMIEPEIAFADLADDADLAEGLLKHCFRTLLDRRGDDLAFFNERVEPTCIARLENFVDSPFERMDYGDAIKALESAIAKGKKFEFPVSWGTDLQSEHERYLTEEIIGKPVVLMNYPKDIKAFYMRMNDDGQTVAAMDVLAPGVGEIIGGSQREERLDVLDARLDEMGLPKEDYWWYRDLRRYGSVPHAGFGLGFERLVSYATGMANIRDVIPFPRTRGHAEF